MDLGIAGRRALVCGASRGLGYGCAEALAREGVAVTIVARTADALAAARDRLAAIATAPVTMVVADITTDAGRAAALAACPNPDIIITNAGGPPPGDFRLWDRDTWIRAIDANMLAPIALIKATLDGMVARGFGRVVNITSSSVKAPLETLGLSNGARSGLTGFIAGIARTNADAGVTINNLLPGAFDTDRLQATLASDALKLGRSLAESIAVRREGIPAKRFGTPAEFGSTCAFLCSTHAGYITGQNVLIDGGAYPGTF